MKTFWNKIRGNEKDSKSVTEWIKNAGLKYTAIDEQEWNNIDVKEVLVLKKKKMEIPPGIDKVFNCWINTFPSMCNLFVYVF